MSGEKDPENGTVLEAEDLDALRIAELELFKVRYIAKVNDLKWELACRNREDEKRADLHSIEEAKKVRDKISSGIESKYEMGVSLSTE